MRGRGAPTDRKYSLRHRRHLDEDILEVIGV
jgi:hypothetical protein